MPEYPMHIVSMDFVIPLPVSSRGNTALLLFQDMFTGFIMSKAMRETTAQDVAEAYEEVVFRRFGASVELRHDRDPRFMSEVFVAFARMMGSQQRATLAYRPQANGQQERSVQTVIRTVKAYVEEPGQEDWEELVGRLMFALNTSVDATRRETPFFLMHGWDPKTTMSAMLSPRPSRGENRLSAYLWRLRVQRQYEQNLEKARVLQEKAKRNRAEERNRAWETLADKYKTGFEIGDAVWMYIPLVRPGLTRKLAHVWAARTVPYHREEPRLHVQTAHSRIKLPVLSVGSCEQAEAPSPTPRTTGSNTDRTGPGRIRLRCGTFA
jgi:hypothetical protein